MRLTRGVHRSWCDSVDPDALGGELHSERAGEGDDSAC